MKLEHDASAATIIKVTALTTLTRFVIRLACFAALAGLGALAYYLLSR